MSKHLKMLLGGSPCTHWSIAQKNNRETEPEGLGWELFKNFLIAKEKFKPDYFLYENNKSAAKAIKDQIKTELGVNDGTMFTVGNTAHYIEINSALVSAQNRQRFYVHNVPGVEQPADRGILLKDILESGGAWNEKSYCLDASYYKGSNLKHTIEKSVRTMVAEPVRIPPYGNNDKARPINALYPNNAGLSFEKRIYSDNPNKQQIDYIAEPIRIGDIGSNSQAHRVYSAEGKSVTINAGGGGQGGKTGLYACPIGETKNGKTYPVYEVKNGLITIKDKQYPIKLPAGYYIIRKLTVKECCRLQTVRDNYIFPVSNSQAYKMLGNGWTVEVIKHILSYIPDIANCTVEVLSMYDGMSCGQIALTELGCKIHRYVSYEIDKYAIQTTQMNFPKTEQRGDAFQLRNTNWSF